MKFRDAKALTVAIATLGEGERAIIETMIERLSSGRKEYGYWKIGDGRDNRQEALEEVIDALNYCAAELVRLRGAE